MYYHKRLPVADVFVEVICKDVASPIREDDKRVLTELISALHAYEDYMDGCAPVRARSFAVTTLQRLALAPLPSRVGFRLGQSSFLAQWCRLCFLVVPHPVRVSDGQCPGDAPASTESSHWHSDDGSDCKRPHLWF